MAQTIKLKRSAVSGNTPSTSDLELGEIAINTYDGKVFIKKDDGSASVIEVGAADNTKLPLAGGTMTGALNMGGNNITSSSNLTLDVAGNINLDADNSGNVYLRDDGVAYGRFHKTNNNWVLKNVINEGDILFQGKDSGGSELTALTLDMSDAGAAIFNGHGTFNDTVTINSTSTGAVTVSGSGGGINLTGGNNRIYFGGQRALEGVTSNGNIQIGEGFSGNLLLQMNTEVQGNLSLADNRNLRIGSGPDLQLYHDGTNSYIKNDTGDLIVDAANDIVLDADGADVILKDAGTEFGRFSRVTSDFVIKSATSDKDIIFKGVDDGTTITALTLDMSEGGSATFANNVTISGNLEVTGTTTQTGSIITNSNFTGLSDANSANATDFGFYGKYVESSTTKYAGMYYDASTDNTFKLFCDTQTAPTTTVNESATGYALANLNIAGLTTTGNVGIGATTPSQKLDVAGNTTSNTYILRANGSAPTADAAIFRAADNTLAFSTASTERMRIGSGGTAMVGKTQSNVETVGVELRQNGTVTTTASGTAPLVVNRTTSDGNIAEFRKENSVIGSIGAAAGRMYIHNNYGSGAGLRFDNASIRPATSTGGGENGTTDLGSTGVRFKDLYLSGSANIGTNILMSNASTSGFMQVSTNILQFGTSSNDPLAIFTNNSEQIRIDTDGRLLLNTTSSIDNLAQLHIVGFTSGRAGITLQDGDSTTQKTFFTQSAGTTRFNTQNGSSYGSFQIGGWNGTTSADFVRVTGDGRVGIGTTAPGAKLHVYAGDLKIQSVSGTGGQYLSFDNTHTGGREYRLISTNDSHGSLGGGDFAILDNDISGNDAAKTRLLINSSGNVGIGTTSPTSTLEVAGTIRTDLIQTRDLSTHTFINLDMDTGGTVGSNNMVFGAVSNMEFLVDTNNNGAAGAFIFKRDSNVPSSATEIMRLTEPGNLGIGTDSPDSKVTIYNAATGITGLVKLWTNTSNNTAADGGAIEWVGSGDKTAIGSKIAATRVLGGGKMDLRFYTGRNSDSNHEKMRILTDGTVGIGTIAPSGAKLHVAGGVKATDLIAHDSTGINLQTDEGTKRLVVADSGVITFNQAYSFPTSDGSNGQALITDGSGNISFGSVSAGAASSMVDADGDTKIQVEESSDEDIIRFDTAGTERARIGVDASSDSTLEIVRSGVPAASGKITFNGSGLITDATSGYHGLIVRTGGTERLRVKDDGNVGIGTTSPAYKLDISAGSAIAARFTGGDSNGITSIFTRASEQGLKTWSGNSYYSGLVAGAHFQIFTNNSPATPRVTVLDTGNVGIGTASPSFSAVNSVSSGIKGIEIFKNGTDTASALKLAGDNGSGTKAFAQVGYSGANATAHFANYNTSGTKVGEIVIGSTGNVGIGTTSPSRKLDVRGSARFSVNTSTHETFTFTTQGVDEAKQIMKNASSVDTIILNTNGNTYFNGGNVGIGTTSPGVKLDIKTTGGYDYGIRVGSEQGNSKVITYADVASTPTKYNWIAGAQFNINNGFEITPSTAVGGYTFSNPALAILQNGNVGIGTTSPGYPLEVQGAGTVTFAYQRTGVSGPKKWGFHSDSSNTYWQNITDNVFGLTVSNAGKIGIGTLSPAAKLDVRGETWTYGSGDGTAVQKLGRFDNVATLPLFTIYTDDAGSTRPLGGDALEFNTTRYGQVIGATRGSAAGANVRAWKFTTSMNGDERGTDFVLYSQTDSSASGSTNTTQNVQISATSDKDSYINTAGKFGIGTAAPAEKLHVNGGNIKVANTNNPAKVLLDDSRATAASEISQRSDGRLSLAAVAGSYGTTGIEILSNGNVGIGTTNPSHRFHAYHPTTNVVARFESGDGQVWIDLHDSNSGTYGCLIGAEPGNDQLFMVADQGVNRRFIIDNAGQVGIGTNINPVAKLQVEELGIDTTTTTTSATTQVAIDTMAAATFRSAEFTIQVTNSTDSTYHLTKVLLIHDGTTPGITEYGTVFTGSAAEATFDADISSGNVRLLATPASTDSMTFKVVRHCITV